MKRFGLGLSALAIFGLGAVGCGGSGGSGGGGAASTVTPGATAGSTASGSAGSTATGSPGTSGAPAPTTGSGGATGSTGGTTPPPSGGSSGGSAGTGGVTPPPNPGGGVTPITGPAPPPANGSWYKGDLHSHSAPYSSDADAQGGGPPGEAFFLAEHVGLDFLALTDHRTMDQVNDPTYSANTLTILDGEEWGGTVHIGMVGLTSQVPEIDQSLGAATLNAQVQAAYDEAHRQGGIVITNHPCQDSKVHVWLSHDFDAVEVWNAYWNFPKGYKDASSQDVDDKVNGLGLAAIGEDANPEIRYATSVRGGGGSHQALKFWEAQLNAGRKKAIVGGGDRHSITFPGLPTTRVYAASQSRGDILDGIRNARTWVGAAEGPEIEFTADADGDGVFETIIGSSVPLNQSVTYRLRVQNALDGRVDVVQNGQTILQFAVQSQDETFTWTDASSTRSWMRVDVFERADFQVASGAGFQLLALAGSFAGLGGMQGLATLGTPLGFQVSLGTRWPTIRLPHTYDKILNFDRMHWGYSRGAITSPIWAE